MSRTTPTLAAVPGAPVRARLRVIAYCRVSTEEQARIGHGLPSQRAQICEAAERSNWEVQWASDEGASGKTINSGLRVALDQLAAAAPDDPTAPRALVVPKLDRLARSVLHAADIMDLARRQGWNLIVLDLGMDLATPQGRALAQTMAVFAELERELISARTRDALAAARDRGIRLGRPRLAPAPVVARIVAEREGTPLPDASPGSATTTSSTPSTPPRSFGAIARDLTADSILSPAGHTKWQASSVRRIYNAKRPDIARQPAFDSPTPPTLAKTPDSEHRS